MCTAVVQQKYIDTRKHTHLLHETARVKVLGKALVRIVLLMSALAAWLHSTVCDTSVVNIEFTVSFVRR